MYKLTMEIKEIVVVASSKDLNRSRSDARAAAVVDLPASVDETCWLLAETTVGSNQTCLLLLLD